MFRHVFLSVVLAAPCSCASTSPSSGGPIRLDATSDATARETFQEMSGQLSAENQQKLALAMLMLNLKGVKSAHEVAANPELQSPSIVRIKDRVAGMTADEIIALASGRSDVKIEVQSQ